MQFVGKSHSKEQQWPCTGKRAFSTAGNTKVCKRSSSQPTVSRHRPGGPAKLIQLEALPHDLTLSTLTRDDNPPSVKTSLSERQSTAPPHTQPRPEAADAVENSTRVPQVQLAVAIHGALSALSRLRAM